MTFETLKKKSSGDAVKQLQEELNKTGIAPLELKVDSKYGSATEAVVRLVQHHCHIEPDGIAGPLFRESLDGLLQNLTNKKISERHVFPDEEHAQIISSLEMSAPEPLIKAVMHLLTGPFGQSLFKRMIIETTDVEGMGFNRWVKDSLEPLLHDETCSLDGDIGKTIESLFPQAHQLQDLRASSGNLFKDASSIAAVLVEAGSLPAQFLEVLDDLGDASLNGQLPDAWANDGVVAAVAMLIANSCVQGWRYNKGLIRLDDAVDKVVGDTLKAGLTGFIVSKIIGSVSAASVPALGLVMTLNVAPAVYAVVSTLCDFIHRHFLGGKEIAEARRLHRQYQVVAQHLQQQLYPRFRRMKRLGDLIEILRQYQKVDDDKRSELASEALQLFQQLFRGDEYFLTSHVSRSRYKEMVVSIVASRVLAQKSSKNNPDIRYLGVDFDDICSMGLHVEKSMSKLNDERRKKITAAEMWKDLYFSEERHFPERARAFESVVEYMVSVEKRRDSEKLITFDVKVGDVVLKVRAKNIFELAHMACLLEDEGWAWSSRPQGALTVGATMDPVQAQKQLVEVKVFSSPSESGYWFNPHYQFDLHGSLRRGEHRLFSLSNTLMQSSATFFLTVPASVDTHEEQAIALKKSLERHHKEIGSAFSVLSLRPISVKSLDEMGALGVFTTLGVRLIPLDSYTCTYQFEDPEEPGKFGYKSIEGYFRNLKEANEAFQAVNQQHSLIGVRPGAPLLTDRLRQQIRSMTRDEAWAIQHQLIGSVAAGLMLLDALANKDEQQIARLAGMGVLCSWWWSLSGRTRRELRNNLKEKLVAQALRWELMETLLFIQRVHLLSNEFFQDRVREMEIPS